jgi:hypothetical protein
LHDVLAGILPLRIVGIDEVEPAIENGMGPPYVMKDTKVPVIPAFTKTVERIDESHLVVVCGMDIPLLLSAYGACKVEFAKGVWSVREIQFYYMHLPS